VTSAGPYANHLQFAPDRQPHQQLINQFFTGRMLFLVADRTEMQLVATSHAAAHTWHQYRNTKEEDEHWNKNQNKKKFCHKVSVLPLLQCSVARNSCSDITDQV